MFAWSYQALSPAAAQLFRLLGLHPGPEVTPAAAASLAGATPVAAAAALAELATVNLVTEPATDRFALHDLLRAYAAELAAAIDTEPQRQAARNRLLDYYLQVSLAATSQVAPHRKPITAVCPSEPAVAGAPTDEPAARAWYEVEHQTLRAAVTLAADTGFHAHSWQLAWALTAYWDLCGRWHDQISTLPVALTAAQQLADRTGEAHLTRLLGHAQVRLGGHDDARRHLERALVLFRDLGDPVGQAFVHAALAVMCGQQGRNLEALRHCQLSLQLHQAADDSPAVPGAMNNLAVAYGLVGDYRRSLAHARRALPLLERGGYRHGEAAAWDTMGHAHHQLGDYSQAVTCYLRSLEIYQAIDSMYDQAEVLAHLGDTHCATGNQAAARDHWSRALSILEEIGHPDADQVRGKLQRLAADW